MFDNAFYRAAKRRPSPPPPLVLAPFRKILNEDRKLNHILQHRTLSTLHLILYDQDYSLAAHDTYGMACIVPSRDRRKKKGALIYSMKNYREMSYLTEQC